MKRNDANRAFDCGCYPRCYFQWEFLGAYYAALKISHDSDPRGELHEKKFSLPSKIFALHFHRSFSVQGIKD